ncbi:discoidin domain-containing protein [Granulicella mallensis]|uniref:F5/8 type C domain-containing protein n=1 Tax=Granulicella mallensis TaxID=940614 RepID=A0A7W7ZQH9_9BACT|nr:discoidin domain-containing protein [Granulicella mallensis]MBB5064237.1 hypothetical protein [Granulicella mallensis]
MGIFYDLDGHHYGIGVGLSVYVDGKRSYGPKPLAPVKITIPPARLKASALSPRVDLLVNPGVPDGPIATASSSITPAAIEQAIDGRLWFFPENPNGWTPAPENTGQSSWYSIDLRQNRTIDLVKLYFFSDGKQYQVPSEFQLQTLTPGGWQDIQEQQHSPQQPIANGENDITFPAITTQNLRVVISNPSAPATFRLIEIEGFAP